MGVGRDGITSLSALSVLSGWSPVILVTHSTSRGPSLPKPDLILTSRSEDSHSKHAKTWPGKSMCAMLGRFPTVSFRNRW